MVDISPFGYASDVEFAHWMAKEIGVAPVPGSSFFANGENRYVRLNFAKKPATLHAAGERLFGPMQREVARRAFKPAVEACRIVPGMLSGTAGVIGAAKAYLDQRLEGLVA